MTDFQPESSWIEPASSGADFWASSPAPLPEQHAAHARTPAQRRPAPALAADVKEMLDSMARKRVPRLDAVRKRLHEGRTDQPLAAVAEAVQALQASTGAVDFLAGRSGGERAGEFMKQGEALAKALGVLVPSLADFLQREGIGAPVSRLVWADLVMESGSLRKRVRQAAHWLAEMDQDLVRRRTSAPGEVALQAIDELTRRALAMHTRLQAVHHLCGQARTVHSHSERMASERAALWTTLQDRVLPACAGLDEALQPLLHAASYRALVPTELVVAIDACHALQVELNQAAAQLARLDGSDAELVLQLARMADMAGSLMSPGAAARAAAAAPRRH